MSHRSQMRRCLRHRPDRKEVAGIARPGGRRTPAARRERSVGRGRRTHQAWSLPGVGSRVGTGIEESLDQSVDRRSAGPAGSPTLVDRSWFHVVFVVPGRGMPYFSANAPVQSLCLPSRPEPVTTA
jgi:hypothetical protein